MKRTPYRVLVPPGSDTVFSWKRLVGPLSLAGFLVAWWLTFGPSLLGGPATFTIVDGRSMEPTYDYGDFVVARREPSYEVGDVVVFPATNGRMIIHRIVSGNSGEGWTTRGDNNDRDDSWILPNQAILGSEWFSVAKVGHAMLWTQKNPMVFAGAVGAAVLLLSLVSGRFRRLHPMLKGTARHGCSVPLLEERRAWEVVLLLISGLAAISSLVGLVLLWSVDLILSVASAATLPILATSVIIWWFVSRRIFDGRGLTDPQHSKVVLSAGCKIVDELPETEKVVDYSSAKHFRRYLILNRLPLLRHHHPDGSITFLTLTRKGVGHRWKVAAPNDFPAEDRN